MFLTHYYAFVPVVPVIFHFLVYTCNIYNIFFIIECKKYWNNWNKRLENLVFTGFFDVPVTLKLPEHTGTTGTNPYGCYCFSL